MANGDIPTALLSYDAATGMVVWLVNKGIAKAGQVASSVNALGYGRVKINGKSVLAHRLAWALHYGEWPDGAIDHINGIKTDNRLCNLRLATRAQNQQNDIEKLDRERNEITQDQARVRENMKAIDKGTDLYSTYIKKFADQEKRVGQIADEFAHRLG